MTKKFLRLVILIAGLPLLFSLVGCDEKRSPLTDRQVDELLSIPAESTVATRELVEHDARSREALIALQADVQKEFAEIGRRQDELERERKAIATERRVTPIIATSIQTAGLIVACLLPLVVVTLLLWPRKLQQESDAVCDYLAGEVVAANESARLTHKLPTEKRLTRQPRERES
jgi:hypothetical protein